MSQEEPPDVDQSDAGGNGHGHSDASVHVVHGHGHGSRPWLDYPLDRVGLRLGLVVLAVVAATVVLAVVLWPREDIAVPQVLVGTGVERVNVDVTAVTETDCFGAPEDSPVRCVDVRFSLPDGGEGSFQQAPSVGTPTLEAGDQIVVADQGTVVEERFRFFFLDFQRANQLWMLAVLFAGAVILLGRLQGIRSLLALLLSFVILIGFTLPALLETDAPVLVAVVGSAGVALVTLYLTHGVNHLTTVALLGSLCSLALTGLLAWLFVQAATITGFSDEDVLFLLAGNEELDVRGVLLAGIIIGTIGVLDDVTVTQASAVDEIHAADPTMVAHRLYGSALRVGRDHIGSTTNTLVFAYAGAALPLLLLFTQAKLSLGVVLTSEIVAIEIVRALVGAIGLVASVPLTTLLATWVVTSSHPDPQAPRHGRTNSGESS